MFLHFKGRVLAKGLFKRQYHEDKTESIRTAHLNKEMAPRLVFLVTNLRKNHV